MYSDAVAQCGRACAKLEKRVSPHGTYVVRLWRSSRAWSGVGVSIEAARASPSVVECKRRSRRLTAGVPAFELQGPKPAHVVEPLSSGAPSWFGQSHAVVQSLVLDYDRCPVSNDPGHISDRSSRKGPSERSEGKMPPNAAQSLRQPTMVSGRITGNGNDESVARCKLLRICI